MITTWYVCWRLSRDETSRLCHIITKNEWRTPQSNHNQCPHMDLLLCWHYDTIFPSYGVNSIIIKRKEGETHLFLFYLHSLFGTHDLIGFVFLRLVLLLKFRQTFDEVKKSVIKEAGLLHLCIIKAANQTIKIFL